MRLRSVAVPLGLSGASNGTRVAFQTYSTVFFFRVRDDEFLAPDMTGPLHVVPCGRR
jgi:hypothetical protein